MNLVYFSLTNNTKRFAERIADLFESVSTLEYSKQEDFVLVTPTFGYGQAPVQVVNFLKKNSKNCKGVISAGHKNWGKHFATAGDMINWEFGIPCLMKIEQAGEEIAKEKIMEVIENL